MVVIGGVLYSVGGIRGDANESNHYERAVADTFGYDTKNDSWSSRAAMPKALWGQGAAAVDGRILTFGGAETNVYGPGSPVSAIYAFTPGSGWSTLSETCPEPVFSTRAVTGPDGLIYIVGGATGAENPSDTARIWRFDPSSETVDNPGWAQLPAPRRWVSATARTVGKTDYLYVMGGHNVSSGNLTSAVHRYPLSGPKEGEREKLSDAPTAFRQATSDCVIDGRMYIAFGHHSNADFQTEAGFKRDVYRYDLARDSWDADMPKLPEGHGRVPGAHGVAAGSLYVAGGHIKQYSGAEAHVTRNYVNVLSANDSGGGGS